MSYCRFSEGDVYLFYDVGGYFNCMCCRIAPLQPSLFTIGSKTMGWEPCKKCDAKGCVDCMMHGSTQLNSPQEALVHMEAHRVAGHEFPEDAIERLTDESAGG